MHDLFILTLTISSITLLSVIAALIYFKKHHASQSNTPSEELELKLESANEELIIELNLHPQIPIYSILLNLKHNIKPRLNSWPVMSKTYQSAKSS